MEEPEDDEAGGAGRFGGLLLRAWNRVVALSSLATLVVWIVGLIVAATASAPDSTAPRVVFVALAAFDILLATFFGAYFAVYVWYGRVFSRGYRLALVVDVVFAQLLSFSMGFMAFWVGEGQPYGVATTFYLLDNFLSGNVWLAAIDWFASGSAVYMHASDGLFVPIHWASRLYATVVALVEYFVILLVLTEGVGEVYAYVARRERKLERERDLEEGKAEPSPSRGPHRKRSLATGAPTTVALSASRDADDLASHPLIVQAKRELRAAAAAASGPSTTPPPSGSCVVRFGPPAAHGKKQ